MNAWKCFRSIKVLVRYSFRIGSCLFYYLDFGSCSLKKFDFNILGIDFLLFFPLVLNFKLDLYYLTNTKRFANHIYIEKCGKYEKKLVNIYI